ncbi:MAG: OB-fold domain-containing protein [Alphaproteobacteria bacterium]|nr:OB-fold domain-containing protein [Alphaproteobacteria bacterium]MCW5740920.1 OB-fold domain-containing protein [Alphaproteobacteria bacterium]
MSVSADPHARAFWQQVQEGRIAYSRCCADHCGAPQFPPKARCDVCDGDRLEMRLAAGTGTIFSITVVHRPPSDALRKHAPYGIALVDLDEGFRMMAHADSDLAIGARVRVGFVLFGDRVVPRFVVDQNP